MVREFSPEMARPGSVQRDYLQRRFIVLEIVKNLSRAGHGCNASRRRNWHAPLYPRNIPAIDAEMRLAMVPASMARTPSCASSLRRSGTRALMPPI